MPIYAYKCGSCGHAKDVLQKISDAPLTDCPECGQPSFSKQLSAPGFQLKGSGWYATDFKGGAGGTSAPPATPATSATDAAGPAAAGAAAATAVASSEASASSTSATGGCGASCACH